VAFPNETVVALGSINILPLIGALASLGPTGVCENNEIGINTDITNANTIRFMSRKAPPRTQKIEASKHWNIYPHENQNASRMASQADIQEPF
jgi:hypothetical protein